jgi:integrase
MHPLSEKQSERFVEAAKGDRFYALYVLGLTTGMREGELLALHWQDIDFAKGTLRVRLGVQEDRTNGHRGRFILDEPKTDYSKRTIMLSQMALEALQEHQVRQQEERAAVGDAWDSSRDLVFPNTIGTLMIPDNLTKRSFKSILKRADLPDIRLHDIRHTAATLLLSHNVNIKVVSEMLGHADIATTLRIYGHVLPTMQ